ncbi:MAG TPA: galactokinase [Gemmatimonadaceae bacterium]|nr:galactokinase [Gemmatimonadaceae bacterium]
MTLGTTTTMRAATAFKQRYGRMPDVVASAPGRVNLIGEHIDYNGGDVLPIAIGQRTHVAAMRSSLGKTRVRSLGAGAEGIFDAENPPKAGDWWDYVAGVTWAFKQAGKTLPQFDLAIASDVPQSAGLSSSASLEVAVAAAINALIGAPFDARKLADLAFQAESEFVGVACGIMDQFASALAREGQALLIHCDSRATEYVPFPGYVLILDTTVRRDLRNGAFNERRRECAMALAWMRAAGVHTPDLAHAPSDVFRRVPFGEPLGSRARHVVGEHLRVTEAVSALRDSGHIPRTLLQASHESLRTLYDCSTPELDWIVDAISTQPGVSGARLTGAGWGGCAIALGDNLEALHAAAAAVRPGYESKFGRAPEAWVTRAGPGIQIEQV